MIDQTIKDTKSKYEKVIENLKNEFASIRTGRANPGLLASVTVSYYGTPTPLQQLSSITVQDNKTLVVSPFDKGVLDAAVKGLQESNIGVNPARDGDIIRVTVPELTNERRKEYAKMAKERAEEAKISLRSIRHKSIDIIDKSVKDKEIGEDDGKRGKDEINKVTESFNKNISDLLSHKENEIMQL